MCEMWPEKTLGPAGLISGDKRQALHEDSDLSPVTVPARQYRRITDYAVWRDASG